MNYINYNGKILLPESPAFPSINRAFLYGDALFESMAGSGTRVPLFEKHFQRLTKGLKTLKMDAGNMLKAADILNQIEKLIIRNKLFKGNRIRLTVFRDSEGLYTPNENTISYIIQAVERESDRFFLSKGKVIDQYPDIRKPINQLSELKSTNALLYVMAGVYRKEQNIDDCMILNDKNGLVETISSNLFLFHEDKIITPSLKSGCVDGIMRKFLMDMLKDSKYPVNETDHLEPKILNEADEIFMTNAVQGISWTLAYKERRFYNKISKELTERLNETLWDI